MLAHCKPLILHLQKWFTASRTAVENGEGSIDKDATSHDDIFDAFRLALMRYDFEVREPQQRHRNYF